MLDSVSLHFIICKKGTVIHHKVGINTKFDRVCSWHMWVIKQMAMIISDEDKHCQNNEGRSWSKCPWGPVCVTCPLCPRQHKAEQCPHRCSIYSLSLTSRSNLQPLLSLLSLFRTAFVLYFLPKIPLPHHLPSNGSQLSNEPSLQSNWSTYLFQNRPFISYHWGFGCDGLLCALCLPLLYPVNSSELTSDSCHPLR